MFLYRFIQICVYVALIAIGYAVYKNGNKLLDRFSRWLQKKNKHKDWIAIPGGIIILCYLAFCCFVSGKIEIVYIENNRNIYHLTRQCNEIVGKVSTTFQFEAAMKGYFECEDCEIEREMKANKLTD